MPEVERQGQQMEREAEEQMDRRLEVVEEPEMRKDLDHKLLEPEQVPGLGVAVQIAEKQMDQRTGPVQSDFVQLIAVLMEDWQSWEQRPCNCLRTDQREPQRTVVVVERAAEMQPLPWPNCRLLRLRQAVEPIGWFVEALES